MSIFTAHPRLSTVPDALEWLASEFLRCPACAQRRLERAIRPGDGLRCAACETFYPDRHGILDLIPAGPEGEANSAEDADQAHYWEEEEHMYRPWDHEVALGFARQRAAYVRRHLPLDEISSAVDVGAGNGMSTACLQNDIDTIFSLDMSRRLLTHSPARRRLRADAYRLPFADKSVDLVYSWELLHHVAQPRTALTEMARVARKYVFFFDPNRWNPAQVAFALINKPDRACLRNTRRFFLREVCEAGLEPVHHACVGWLTPNVPPVWLYRLMRRLPFRVPLVGISHFVLARCPRPADTES